VKLLQNRSPEASYSHFWKFYLKKFSERSNGLVVLKQGFPTPGVHLPIRKGTFKVINRWAK